MADEHQKPAPQNSQSPPPPSETPPAEPIETKEPSVEELAHQIDTQLKAVEKDQSLNIQLPKSALILVVLVIIILALIVVFVL